MKKIGFVTPWYGENIPGGAEMELRGLVTHLAQAGTDVEVLTTCVRQFSSDWNVNYHKPGLQMVNGIGVRRFKVRKRDTAAFDAVNAKLMHQIPISAEEEQIYVREMVNSPDLYQYIKESSDEYSLFVFIPYMFGTTYYGMQQCPQKSVLIPCFHDESYIYMDVYKKVFQNIAGIIYHAKPEYDLANKVFKLDRVQQAILGEGVYTEFTSDAARFRSKYHINVPFILYAGRKDKGKNVDTLIKYFREFKLRHENSELKLLMIGGGKISIPEDSKRDIIDLGFVDQQDKFDSYAASLVLCQPSKNESFSLVVMESWLCGRPVLVHGDCAVTKDFARQTNAGLYFTNYFEFEGCIEYFLREKATASQMGKMGREFVLSHFAWDVIVKNYTEFFESLIQQS